MYDKISKAKLKRIFVFKFAFQLFATPILTAIFTFAVSFIALLIVTLAQGGSVKELIEKNFVIKPGEFDMYEACLFMGCLSVLPTILSVIPFTELIIDCFSKNDEETKEIYVSKVFFPYELQCVRQSKRFICDTFSKKENIEVFLYDENKKKYRMFWNENYGDYAIADDVTRADRLKISYFKHSKIIFKCEKAPDIFATEQALVKEEPKATVKQSKKNGKQQGKKKK